MSKASEWAGTRIFAPNPPTLKLRALNDNDLRGHGAVLLIASATARWDRLGAHPALDLRRRFLAPTQALELARWILDAFEGAVEAPP